MDDSFIVWLDLWDSLLEVELGVGYSNEEGSVDSDWLKEEEKVKKKNFEKVEWPRKGREEVLVFPRECWLNSLVSIVFIITIPLFVCWLKGNKGEWKD